MPAWCAAGNRTAKDLHTFAVSTFPDIVTRISGSNIDSAFGSTMSQPKLVLFTDKEDTPGMFRALAASFRKYKLLFFTIHSSDEQAKKTFGIQKVLVFFLACLCLVLAEDTWFYLMCIQCDLKMLSLQNHLPVAYAVFCEKRDGNCCSIVAWMPEHSILR